MISQGFPRHSGESIHRIGVGGAWRGANSLWWGKDARRSGIEVRLRRFRLKSGTCKESRLGSSPGSTGLNSTVL